MDFFSWMFDLFLPVLKTHTHTKEGLEGLSLAFVKPKFYSLWKVISF